MDQRGKGCDQMDAAVVPYLRRQRRAPSAPCPRVQPRQLHADAGNAASGGAVVADQPAREADQDRREGCEPRPLRHLPNGRNRGATADVRRYPVADRPTAGTACASMSEQRDQMRQATSAKVCLDLAKSARFIVSALSTASFNRPLLALSTICRCPSRSKERSWPRNRGHLANVHLREFPLEYFGKGIRWLQRQEGVQPQPLGVLGQSRGGELALLLGATFPEIGAVVAYVPSGVLWMGIQLGDAARTQAVPAWTFDGRPIPFMRRGIDAAAVDWTHQPVALSPGYCAALQDSEIVEHATIPVERSRGPILMISGQEDHMSSPKLAEIAEQRAKHYNFSFDVEHLSYPDAGHLLTLPYLPTTIRQSRHPIRHVDVDFGGTPAGDAFARADSWPKVLKFLQKNLDQHLRR